MQGMLRPFKREVCLCYFTGFVCISNACFARSQIPIIFYEIGSAILMDRYLPSENSQTTSSSISLLLSNNENGNFVIPLA